MSDTDPYWSDWSPTITVECPFCNRVETFANETAANAWATGHIHEDHPDELPAFETGSSNSGGESDD